MTIGPLKISQQARHQLELFCTQPLVLDYMARKFSTLPALTASEKRLQEAEEAQRCRHERLSVQNSTDDHSRDVWDELYVVLAGLHPIFGSVTFLPGAQFILTELATKPTLCYSVPAVRMVMHLIVYLAMLILFGSNVLLSSDDVGVGETIFFIYTMVRVYFLSIIINSHARRERFLAFGTADTLFLKTLMLQCYRFGWSGANSTLSPQFRRICPFGLVLILGSLPDREPFSSRSWSCGMAARNT